MQRQKNKFKETEIRKEKISHLFLSMRCVKKKLTFGKKEFNVFVIKDSSARTQLSEIIVNNSFFENFNKKEQEAILYHEKHHQKFFTILKRFYYILRFFSFRKAKWQEEFDADSSALKMTSKQAIKSFLEKSKKSYAKGDIAYNKKTHPPIDERIQRVVQK